MHILHDSGFYYRNGDENNETRFKSHNYDYAALNSIVECVDLLTVDILIKSCIIYAIHNSGCDRRVWETTTLYSIGFFLVVTSLCVEVIMIQQILGF